MINTKVLKYSKFLLKLTFRPCEVNYLFIITDLAKIKIRDLLIIYYFINFIIIRKILILSVTNSEVATILFNENKGGLRQCPSYKRLRRYSMLVRVEILIAPLHNPSQNLCTYYAK